MKTQRSNHTGVGSTLKLSDETLYHFIKHPGYNTECKKKPELSNSIKLFMPGGYQKKGYGMWLSSYSIYTFHFTQMVPIFPLSLFLVCFLRIASHSNWPSFTLHIPLFPDSVPDSLTHARPQQHCVWRKQEWWKTSQNMCGELPLAHVAFSWV